MTCLDKIRNALEYDLDDAYNLVSRSTGPDLNVDGVVGITVDTDNVYGIKIINNIMLALQYSVSLTFLF